MKRSLSGASQPKYSALQQSYTPTDLGMNLAQACALLPCRLSLRSVCTKTQPGHLLHHSRADCFPIGALRDTWTRRDLFTSEPLLVPHKERVKCLWKIHAQRTRDLPIWKVATMSFAPKDLELQSLPQGFGLTIKNSFMNFFGQLVTTSPRKPPLHPPGPTSLNSRCALHRTDGKTTLMTMFLAFAPIPSSTSAVASATTNNSNSTKSLQISSNDFFPRPPNLFSPRNAIEYVPANGIRCNRRHSLNRPLLFSDSSAAITAVLLDVSRSLVKCVDTLWEAWKQTKYI